MTGTTAPSSGSRLFASPTARLIQLALLVLVLLIPMGMINGVIQERAQRRTGAAAEVATSWGGAQTIAGPLLKLRCISTHQTRDARGWVQESTTESFVHVLPERLYLDARLRTESRHRGLFEIPVYTSQLRLEGEFAAPAASSCTDPSARIDWPATQLILGIREPRGLHADAGLKWNDQIIELRPGTNSTTPALGAGIQAALGKALPQPTGVSKFSIGLVVNGTEQLMIAPMAKETSVQASGDWPHISYQGAWLPAERTSDDHSFSSRWSVSYLGRGFPQSWETTLDQSEAIGKATFGIQLMQPVSPYVMAERVAKYAALTVIFTFLAVWLTEVLSGRRVHPIQYAFVGAALCLFGLLQLAIAEHLGFTVAFVTAAVAVTGLVTLYCRSVLQSLPKSLAVGGLLGLLYGYLYSILRAEDYALLGGTLALFVLLAAAMYLTRRIDWQRTPAT